MGLVGITSAWSVETWGHTKEHGGYYYVGSFYAQAIYKSGGLPVLINIPPLGFDLKEEAQKILQNLSGLLLSGGGDAKRFSKEELPSLKEQQPHRYEFEKYLILKAYEMDIPILGICRGFQMLVEVFGGKLYDKTIDNHKQNLPGYKTWHKLLIKPNTMLYEITQKDQILVNSFHIQAVEKVPYGFKVCGISEDGIIEAIQSEEKTFVLGLQFHPEELYETQKEAKAIFDRFLKHVNRYKSPV